MGIVFMCNRIAKVDKQAIAQELGNIAFKAVDDLCTYIPISKHDLPEIFRVELF
jgi:hypothetical protein